jgi:hypothetical protein
MLPTSVTMIAPLIITFSISSLMSRIQEFSIGGFHHQDPFQIDYFTFSSILLF